MNHRQIRPLSLKIRSSSASVRLSLVCGVALLPLCASAQTWLGTVSSDYETAGNWSPSGVPNSPGANLVFGAGAGTTNVTLSTPYPAGYTFTGGITFNDPGSAYSVAVSNTAYLSITGNVVNTSGVTQNFSITGDASTGAGSEIILNGVNAGSNVTYTVNPYATLQVNGASNLTSARVVLNGGSIAYSGSGVLALGAVSGVGILAYYGNPSGTPGTLQLGGTNDSATVTAQIQEQMGSVSVQKVGTGTLTLDGPSTYTGGTALTSGGLLVGNNTALGTSGLSVASGTLFGSADGLPVSLANTVTLAAGAETIDTTGGDLTLTGAVSETGGSAAVTKTGGNALVLAVDATYSGGTTISAGTLQLGNGGTTGSVLGSITDNGTLAFDRSDNVQFSQAVSGSGGISQIGTGTVSLTVAENVTGAVSVAAGSTLALTGAGDVSTASGVSADGTFDVSGAASDAKIKTLSGSGAVNLGGKSLTLTQAGGTFSGSIGGTGGLMLASGTEVLTGSNTYTGKTTIATGSTVQLGNGGATGSVAGDVSNAGTLAVNRTGDVTIAGAITGTGSVEKAGSGTLTLSGDNTYSGGTVVAAGTLSLTTDNSAGTGMITLGDGTSLALANGLDVTNALDISGNVSLVVANGSAVESGTLTGTGTYSLSGGGTLHLTGNNGGFTGKTVLSGLTVDLATDSALGTGAAQVVGKATLHYENGVVIANAIAVTTGSLMTAEVSGGASATQTGAISGNGGLAKIGGGTFILTGNSSYAGGTALNAGTLVAGSANALGTGTLAMAAGTTLGFGGNFTLANAITVSGDPTFQVNTGIAAMASGVIADGASTGDIVKTGAGTLILTGANSYSGGTTVSAGTLQLGNGGAGGSIAGNVTDNGTLAFDRSDAVSFRGQISGSGTVRQTGAGTLTLSANDAAFTGATEVANGTLAVNGTLGGSLAVDGGATLAGTGTVGSTTVASGGTLSPAGAGTIGTLTVKGNLSLASGSTYAVNVDPAGHGDLVHATGTASLGGGKVAVVAGTGNWLVSTRYTILTANAGVSGTFGSVSSNFAFLTPTLAYDADDVFLTLKRNNVDFASLAVTPNQRAAANGLASLGGGALANAVVQLTAPEAPSAFSQLSGEIHASVKSVLIDDSRFVRDAGIDRIRSAFGGPGASTASVTAYSDGTADAAPATTDGPAFWSQGYGSWGHNDSDGNAAKATHSTGGFLAGADAPVANGWRAGVLAGYSRTDFNASGRGDSDNYSLGVYGGNQWGALGLRLGMAYSWNDIDTHRTVAFTGVHDSLSASYSAQTVQGFGDLGYKLPVAGNRFGQVVFEPFAGLAYVGLRTDGFAERGGAAALSAGSQAIDETFTTLGLRASDGFTLNGLQLTAIGTAGWRHSYNAVAPTSTLRFIGSDAFTVAGVPIARDAAVIEAGLSTDVTQTVSLSVTYTGQFGNGTQDQGLRGNIAWKF